MAYPPHQLRAKRPPPRPPAPALTPAEPAGYVLCTFLGPGPPWSEGPLDTPFGVWAQRNLKAE
eukprot:4684085-Lingulodinium_polyedra.AAC.1